ncbi:MAG: dephospho-CoA kinase [Planctomycetes bacterium]|nr:dephospho-CoA kinase [Planctomycetota bacterium]
MDDVPRQSPRVIGLIGGIGSGKSQVARVFAEETGGKIISGDVLGHEALKQPEVRDAVVRRWGASVLDAHGEVDRRKLGGIVFAKVSELTALEGLVHPWIKRRIGKDVEAFRRDASVPLVVLDAAILLEAGWDGVCDALVFVDVPRALRLQRIAGQRGWTQEEVEARERAQLPLSEKAGRADFSLDNSGTVEDLRRQVRSLLDRWDIPRAGPNP